ncbi:MAG TPA: NADH-quinone oxidoreductase subunit M [Vicinamibacterales bacterium]|nr:NADH-quinone oxidoreductase subunit M [Vicinamibacterales bacterium]
MILSLIVFLPLAGALLVLLAGGSGDRPDREGLVKTLALVVSLVTFAATLVLWWMFDPASADYQFVERHAWMPTFGIQYLVGVDGISLFLVVLTGFLTPLALLSSWDSVHKSVKMFAFFMLALESSMLGVFVAIDLFLFYMFWDFVLIPMYFLIGIWGYERRVYAAVKFILYTMAGSVLMLVAIIGLAWAYDGMTGAPSFNLLDLQKLTLSWPMERWFFLAFALAFLIKVPLFPFHTWLPDAHVEAPTAGSVILAGVMLKMGTYGLVRFAFPLFPSAAMHYAPWIAAFAVIGIIYGALVAMVQPDLKKLVAYSSVSHLGFVVLGLCAMNAQGLQGSIYQMLNHGVSTGGLFMIVGMLSDRRHTRLISEFGGLKAVMPRFVAAFLLVTLSSIALPGMNGFVGEFLILLGGFLWSPKFAAIAASGVILSAVYMLWMFQRVNYGDVTNSKNTSLPDLLPREWALMVPTIAMAIVMGIVPNVFLRPMEPSVKKTIERVTGRSFATTPTAPGFAAVPAPGSRLLAPGQTQTGGSQQPAAGSEQPTAKAARQPRVNSRQPTTKANSNE